MHTSTKTKAIKKINAINLADSLTILGACAFGIFLILATNFSHMTAAHNAAHDTRHSIGFPCH